MKDNKSWYEKISIWITIVAALFAILGISVFGSKSLIRNNEPEATFVNFKDNEVSMGDWSTIVIGDNNTFNYERLETDNLTRNESSTFEEGEFSVIASYGMNTPQTSADGVNVLVEAETSFPAEQVTISAISDENKIEPMDMHGGLYKWQFVATFYIKGTYTITITAYNSKGQSVSDEFIYVY